MKLKLTKSVEDFFQIYASNVNKKYIFFPKVYEKVDNEGTYIERDLKDIPQGFQKYIREKLG